MLCPLRQKHQGRTKNCHCPPNFLHDPKGTKFVPCGIQPYKAYCSLLQISIMDKYPMKTLSMSVVINSKGLQLELTFSPEIVRQTSTNASLYRHEKRRNRKSYALHVVQRGVNPHLAWFPSYNHTHASAWERG